MFTMMDKSTSSFLFAAVRNSSRGTTRFVARSSRSSHAALSILLFLTFLPLNVICQEEGGVRPTKSTFIILKEQIDFISLGITLHNGPHDKDAEERMLLLQELARTTQKPIIDCLEERGITYRSYWITNAISADLPTDESFFCDDFPIALGGEDDENNSGGGGRRRRRKLLGSTSDHILLAVEDTPRDGSAQFQRVLEEGEDILPFKNPRQQEDQNRFSDMYMADEEELDDEDLLTLFEDYDKAPGERHLSPKAAKKSKGTKKKGKKTKKKCWEKQRNNIPYSLDKAPRPFETQISWIGADFAWGDRGNKTYVVDGMEVPTTFGEGRVVGIMDTGVNYKHPALINAYRGTCRDKDGKFTFDHNYNWYDPTTSASPEPVDVPVATFHGTHVTGLAVGGYDRSIGVAPGAKFISCRAFGDDLKFTIEAFTRCYQFLYAPHDLEGNNPDVSLRPYVVSMAYECLDCTREETFFSMNSLFYAGVTVVASAQDEGFKCKSVVNPPGNLENLITIGALKPESDKVALFSSRGPFAINGTFIPKPQLVAPGSSLTSSYEENTYAEVTGTSMATGVATGAYVLISNICPEFYFRQIFSSWRVIQLTARRQKTAECTGEEANPVSPNNAYGFGTINVKQAVRATVGLCVFFQQREKELMGEEAENGDSSVGADSPD